MSQIPLSVMSVLVVVVVFLVGAGGGGGLFLDYYLATAVWCQL